MAAARIKSNLLATAQHWPSDKLRPTLQFSQAIQSATTRIFASELAAPKLLKAQATVDSLTRLLDNTAQRAYPITDKTMKPASFPKHYERLGYGIDKIEKGEAPAKGWFTWIRWK